MARAFGLRTHRSRLSRPGASTVLLLAVLLRMAAAQNATNATTSAPTTTPPGAPPSPECPQGSQSDCDCTVQCCPPGEAQLGDTANDNGGKGSFCTDKPFPESYRMRVRDRVPVQINLRDYCTDKILFSSYSAPRVDEFSLVEFPCTYSASDCDKITVLEEKKMCEDGFKVYTEKLNCTGENSFFEKFVNSRICNKKNAENSGEWFYREGEEDPKSEPPTVGACRCNFTEPIRKKFNYNNYYGSAFYQNKHVEKLTEGVPDYFIKEGMSTFYVEVMIAGRSTAERGSDTECQCSSPADVSEKCMCELGTKKVPYVYNHSYVPQLTALVSMREGQLYFTNTFVKFNFDQSGKACIGCMPDYCYGVPLEPPEECDNTRNTDNARQCCDDQRTDNAAPCMSKTWRQIDFDLRLRSASVCAVPSNPDGRSGVDTSYYCRLPQTTEEVNACSLKVYMAWTGTDRYGRPLESSNMMPSKFTQMGVGNIASQFLTSSGGMIRKIDDRVSGSN